MTGQPRTIAYLRVSTTDQVPERHKAGILHLVNDKGLGQMEWVESRSQAGFLGKKEETPVALPAERCVW